MTDKLRQAIERKRAAIQALADAKKAFLRAEERKIAAWEEDDEATRYLEETSLDEPFDPPNPPPTVP